MNEPTNQNKSPWPACADCQSGADETPAPGKAVQPAPKAGRNVDDDWNPFEVCRELEARHDEILRKAQEAYARAVARAHAEGTTPREQRDEGQK